MRYSDFKIFRFDFVSLYYLIYKIAQDMNVGNTVFSQLMSLIPDYELRKCIDRYRGDFHARRFTCRDQFLVMSYAQLTSSASLRSIEAQLTAFNSKLYHAGLKVMSKSTLADMNEKKDWRIYQDYAMVLVERAKVLYKDEYYRLGIDNMVYAFDSSTINLCLQLCPWAKFHHDKGAFKMHTLIDVKNNIPNFIMLTPGNVHDTQAMDSMPVEAGAYYLMDKGYVDFDRLFRLFQQQKAYFVTRAKDNMKYSVFKVREVDRQTGVISDESISLTGLFTAKKYPDLLRLVVYEDFAQNVVYRFLTNDFTLEAITIAEPYRERWTIETFFKWIKQNLHIKTFYGTSQNAVFTQIWIAICDYLLLIIALKMYHIEQNLYIFSNVIGQVLFERTPLNELFNKPIINQNPEDDRQLSLW